METEKEDNNLHEERNLNLTGKILLASLSAWLVGKAVSMKIRGSQNEIRTVVNALLASKRFHEELYKPGATVQSVIEKLRIKQMSAVEFERVLGVKWPL